MKLTMKTTDLMTVLTAALATASLTVMTFWSGTLEAGNDDGTPATRIEKPTLVADGISMTLAAAQNRTFSAGQEPAFELTAVNTTGESSTVSVAITITASSPADEMSRVPRRPKTLWQQNLPVALQANETKVLAIAVPAKLPPNNMIAVILRKSDPNAATTASANPNISPLFDISGIVALNFSTAVPPVQTASLK